MSGLRFWGACLAALLLAAPADAASTAGHDVPGYETNTPQPNCAYTPCWVPYGPTLPVSTSAGGGVGSASLSKGPISPLVAPTTTASAYTANMAIGGLETVPLYRTTTQPSAILNYISLTSKSGITTPEAVYVFTKSPASTCADHVAFVLSSTDLPYLVPGFPITLTPLAVAGATQTTASAAVNVTTSNADTAATLNAYVCIVTLGTPAPATTSDLVPTYTALQD